MKKKWLAYLLVLAMAGASRAQQLAPDIDSANMILLNPYVQIETNQAINNMYNFKFDTAMRSFRYLKFDYGWHPLPYFLMGLNYWWRIVPNLKVTKWDSRFNSYMDSTILLAQRLYDGPNRIEGAFFLAAAYGFKARLYSDRDNFTRAAWDGRKALKYMKECKDYTEYSPELLFGEALMNYYSSWIRENYPWLRPIMWAFPKGDKMEGVSQLRNVTRNSFYSRTEAQYYLLRILFQDSNEFAEAYELGKYLHQIYPDNPYFHRYYAQILYYRGYFPQAIEESQEVLARIESKRRGYEAASGRVAAYVLGRVYFRTRQYDLSQKYFEQCVSYSIEADATDKGYYFFSLIKLGELAEKKGDTKLAKVLYKQAKKAADRNHSAFKDAKEHLKDL